MAVINLKKDNFEKEVLKSDIPVVVDFWAPWCGPCMMMGPVMKSLAEAYDGKYVIAKVNVDEESELAEEYGIMGVPSIKIFKNGSETASCLGFATETTIVGMIEN